MMPLHHERMGQYMETERRTEKRRILLWWNYLKIPAQCQVLFKPLKLQGTQGDALACRYHKSSSYADTSDDTPILPNLAIGNRNQTNPLPLEHPHHPHRPNQKSIKSPAAIYIH